MLRLFVFWGLCLSVQYGWAQIDNKSAFKNLKKMKGIWLLNQNGEKTYAEWQLTTKNTLSLKEYKLQTGDTLVTKKAYIYYSPFLRFQHISSTHYNIQTLGKDLVYTHRLERIENNQYHFQNIEDKYIFQLNDKTLVIKHISQKIPQVETLTYQKIK